MKDYSMPYRQDLTGNLGESVATIGMSRWSGIIIFKCFGGWFCSIDPSNLESTTPIRTETDILHCNEYPQRCHWKMTL